jgi:hypothetical protein
LLEFQQNERTWCSQQCGKWVDCAGTGVKGVWTAAKEHLIVANFLQVAASANYHGVQWILGFA